MFDFSKRRRELRIPAAACDGLGKHLADDRETRDQVLRQGSRAAKRSQRDGADDLAAHAQRYGEIGPQARAPAELRFHGGFCREVGGARKSDRPAGPKLAEIPGQWRRRTPRDGHRDPLGLPSTESRSARHRPGVRPSCCDRSPRNSIRRARACSISLTTRSAGRLANIRDKSASRRSKARRSASETSAVSGRRATSASGSNALTRSSSDQPRSAAIMRGPGIKQPNEQECQPQRIGAVRRGAVVAREADDLGHQLRDNVNEGDHGAIMP